MFYNKHFLVLYLQSPSHLCALQAPCERHLAFIPPTVVVLKFISLSYTVMTQAVLLCVGSRLGKGMFFFNLNLIFPCVPHFLM